MEFRGLQKLSMVDCPGKLAATVFTGGCNLRCPFCHNALLVTDPARTPVITEEEALSFLASRKGLLDAVVLSGGEPLMHPGAGDFLRKVKDMGYFVKLDTNGCYPDALEAILREGLADYVAMDIKNSPEKYALTTGKPDFDITCIERSIRLLKEGASEYEFRTTVVAELHREEDILAICRRLAGSRKWCLQNFEDSGHLIKDGLHSVSPAELTHFSELAKPYFDTVCIRGI